jgi:hypothetical protein
MGRSPFQESDHFMRWSYTIATNEQVQMVGLDSQAFDVPSMLSGYYVQYLVKSDGYLASQYGLAPLGTPNQMVQHKMYSVGIMLVFSSHVDMVS